MLMPFSRVVCRVFIVTQYLNLRMKIVPDHLPPLKLSYFTTLQLSLCYFRKAVTKLIFTKKKIIIIIIIISASGELLSFYNPLPFPNWPTTWLRFPDIPVDIFLPSAPEQLHKVFNIDIYIYLSWFLHIVIIGPTWWLKSTAMFQWSDISAVSLILYIQSYHCSPIQYSYIRLSTRYNVGLDVM